MWKKRNKGGEGRSKPAPARRPALDPGSKSGDGGTAPATLAEDAVSEVISRLVLDEAVPLYLASPDGVLLYSNAGFDELCGFFRGSAPKSRGRAVPEPVLKAVTDVLAVGHGVGLEDRLRVGGAIKYFCSRHFPVCDDDNNILAVGGTYIDSTEQVEALEQARATQAKFNDFARAASDWYWATDEGGALLSLSERMVAILGGPVNPFIGKHLSALGRFAKDRDTAAGLTGSAVRAIAQHVPFRNQIFEIAGAEGKRFLFHLSGVPVFEPDSGDFQGYRGAGNDITARVAAEKAAEASRLELEHTLEELTRKNLSLDMATAEAEAALKAKSDFLSAMSHELRTPLNAIIGFGEAMSLEVFGKLNKKYTEYSGDIVHAAKHLLELINDVLDVAFIDSGKLSLNTSEIDVDSTVHDAFQLVVLRAAQKEIDTSATAVASGRKIFADQRRTIQIIINLFSNAVKFTPESGAIGVDVRDAGGGGLVAIEVWDTGIGIAPDKHDLVFEKFRQVTDDVYARKETGTGLGMHISRRLARMMGGDITLESEAGKGSRFTLTLPGQAPDGAPALDTETSPVN